MDQLDKHDIQGLVFSGYAKHPCAVYLFLRVSDAPRARVFFEDLVPSVTTGQRKDDSVKMNVALSAAGLRALGLSEEALATFSREFRDGMSGADSSVAKSQRSRILGDVGESDPAKWIWGAAAAPVDVLIMVYALTDVALHAEVARLNGAYAGALEDVFVRTTKHLHGRREHFGFADGIAQPQIDLASERAGHGGPPIQIGEFVLGYPNEYGKLPGSPRVPERFDPHGYLVPADGGTGERDFGLNGTYVVARQLEQDVEAFWGAMEVQSRSTGVVATRDEAVKLASKCVGRWPSGAPLVKSPERDNPALARDDDFSYSDDPHGLACPLGAHIRRTNPRDSLEPGPNESLDMVGHHRILRRGRSYGMPLAPFEREATQSERGLLFICLNANIRRQFEFIQQTWSNNPKFSGLYDDQDPLIGAQPEGGGSHTIPGVPVRRRIHKLSRFVRVRGGEYFFLPSIRALRFLSALAAPAAGVHGPGDAVGASAA